jgi:hypothetical protein
MLGWHGNNDGDPTPSSIREFGKFRNKARVLRFEKCEQLLIILEILIREKAALRPNEEARGNHPWIASSVISHPMLALRCVVANEKESFANDARNLTRRWFRFHETPNGRRTRLDSASPVAFDFADKIRSIPARYSVLDGRDSLADDLFSYIS